MLVCLFLCKSEDLFNPGSQSRQGRAVVFLELLRLLGQPLLESGHPLLGLPKPSLGVGHSLLGLAASGLALLQRGVDALEVFFDLSAVVATQHNRELDLVAGLFKEGIGGLLGHGPIVADEPGGGATPVAVFGLKS